MQEALKPSLPYCIRQTFRQWRAKLQESVSLIKDVRWIKRVLGLLEWLQCLERDANMRPSPVTVIPVNKQKKRQVIISLRLWYDGSSLHLTICGIMAAEVAKATRKSRWRGLSRAYAAIPTNESSCIVVCPPRVRTHLNKDGIESHIGERVEKSANSDPAIASSQTEK
jgi:hypothetical protein